MPSWPIGLPQRPLAEGLGGTDEGNSIEFAPSVGVEHTRPRVTLGRELINCAFSFTDPQLSQFLHFYRETLKRGNLTFTWQDPIDNVAGVYKIKGYRTAYDTFNAADNVDMWRVSMTIRRVG